MKEGDFVLVSNKALKFAGCYGIIFKKRKGASIPYFDVNLLDKSISLLHLATLSENILRVVSKEEAEISEIMLS
jgi:hypothetical protein